MFIERGTLFDAIYYALKHNHKIQYNRLYKVYKDSIESDKMTFNYSNYYDIDSMDKMTINALVRMLIGHHNENGNFNITNAEDLIKNKIFVDKIVVDGKTKVFKY